MKAFILAGGEGTRLRPVTYEIPKPLITVRKKPILSYLVDSFLEHGVKTAFVSINEKHSDDFIRWKEQNHPDADIRLIIEREALGTFAPLMLAREHLSDGPFFVSNGDELKKFDLTALAKYHKDNKALATIGLVSVAEPQHYGVAIRSGNMIKTFVEKPKEPPSSQISSGLYMFSPEIFEHYPYPSVQFSMVEKDLFPKLAEQNKLHGFEMRGQWFDCGTFERWDRAIREWV